MIVRILLLFIALFTFGAQAQAIKESYAFAAVSYTHLDVYKRQASARNKPATLSTGLVIQVPEYLSPGEKIRIHIEERRYMGRAD